MRRRQSTISRTLMNFGNDLKEAYRKRNIIATPLKVNEARQNSLLSEKANRALKDSLT